MRTTKGKSRAEADGRADAEKEATEASASFYESVFSPQELEDIGRLLDSEEHRLDMEVAVMRVMIRRVMAHMGVDDPAQALPLVREAVDAICRALRTQRVLSGEASESLAGAFATALREMGEEIGVGDE